MISLVEHNPELLKEWDYKKKDIDPKKVPYGTQKKFGGFVTKCGNEWETLISSRSRGIGCPKCGMIKSKENLKEHFLKTRRRLKDYYPELVKEWDYEKNLKNGLIIDEMISRSGKKAWWICSQCC